MDEPNNFIEVTNRRKHLIETALERYLPDQPDNPLACGMRYAVLNGGKRLRPILTLEGMYLAGAEEVRALPAACAIEMIHAYSLVHDDLPAMDNDAWRRGQPTCHIRFGEAKAILIGDALLTQAFALLSGSRLEMAVSAEALLQVMEEFAQAAGYQGMILGQTLDLAAECTEINTDELLRIHRYKTGALLTAALRGGGLLGGMKKEALDKLTSYSEQLGLLFQITDDILDVTGDLKTLGKAVGSDQKNHKKTYVSLYGLEGAREKADACLANALKILESFTEGTHFLASLTKNIYSRCS